MYKVRKSRDLDELRKMIPAKVVDYIVKQKLYAFDSDDSENGSLLAARVNKTRSGKDRCKRKKSVLGRAMQRQREEKNRK